MKIQRLEADGERISSEDPLGGPRAARQFG